jgi:hypothetical protein
MEINWKLSLDALSIFGGALAWVYQYRNVRFRGELKADLEILKALEDLDKEKENHRIVKAHIDATISRAYAYGHSRKANQANRTIHINRIDFGFGLIFLLSAGLWTWELIVSGVDWSRVLIAGGFAICGIIALFNAWHKRGVTKTLL